LLRRRATLDDGQPAALADPAIADLRRRIAATGDAAVPREAAHATARLSDGRVLEAEIRHARGSAARPMTDAEIEAKYAAQAAGHLAPAEVATLAAACRDLAAAPALSRSPLAAILPKGTA